ncbi:MAG TPA: hypothetical protein VMX38_03115 [Verrucomicrobiae bacterium]|nr:hypothetical protein [Verrucomicrobiae bacterium]
MAGYAGSPPPKSELAAVLDSWSELKADLCSCQEVRLLGEAGRLDLFPGWIQEGLFAREAWRAVLDREPVSGVLCGDDSNMITRAPVILAANRGIPTADFHHGAFDGRYLLKDLISATYLAKNEMEREYLVRVCGLSEERCTIAAPSSFRRDDSPGSGRNDGSTIVFFSEPYELAAMRSEEVYREVLPPLGRLAAEKGKSLTIKLHPFESRSERTRVVHDVLESYDSRNVRVLDGPLTAELLKEAWFGITVESTSVLDCAQNGVCCFLCAWLSHSPYQYIQQYARFGVGAMLQGRAQIASIPELLVRFEPAPLTQPADPALLKQLLTAAFSEQRSARLA